MGSRRVALLFGLANLFTAGLVAAGVLGGLPARWWPVDLGAAVLVVLELGAAWGLILGASWARRAALAAAAVGLVLGLGLVSTLAVTAAWLSGVYGPVGKGGALLFVLVAALALPYLVALPLAQLAWLRRRGA